MLINASSRHFAAPALAWCLQNHEGLPADFKAYFEAVLGLNDERNKTMLSGLKRVVIALNAHDIEPMLLKGAARLIDNVYPHLSIRFLGDLDLLIEPGRMEEAAIALKKIGFAPKPNDPVGPDHHHLPMLHDSYGLGVELHKSAVLPPFDSILSNTWLWTESSQIHLDGMSVRLPNPTQSLVHNIIHDQLLHHNFARETFELRQLLDFALIVHRQEVEWDEVDRRFKEANIGQVLATYSMFSQSFLGIRPPALSFEPKADALSKFKSRMQTRAVVLSLAAEYMRICAREPLAPLRLLSPLTWANRVRAVRNAFNSSVN
jgi:Uncharacterised nucleotidyltransferase